MNVRDITIMVEGVITSTKAETGNDAESIRKAVFDAFKNCGFICHKEAWTTGYIPRKRWGDYNEYHGRYGDGFTIDVPSYKSSRYHHRYYMIYRGDEDES